MAANSEALVGSIDLGTSSVRFFVFQPSSAWRSIASHHLELGQESPHSGWLQQDPEEMAVKTLECIARVCEQLPSLGFSVAQIKGVGVTNQRETLVLWSRSSGKSLYPAIVWSDNRNKEIVQELIDEADGNANVHHPTTGLPLSHYFTATKYLWALRNVPAVKEAVESEDLMLGTCDTWLLWKLTGEHVTDVTNASRTLLLDLSTVDWDDTLISRFSVPRRALPRVRSSAETYGVMNAGSLAGVPVCGILGDQQAALVGHGCFTVGECKNTYGTGCFLLCNIGTHLRFSDSGLSCQMAAR